MWCWVFSVPTRLVRGDSGNTQESLEQAGQSQESDTAELKGLKELS